MSTTHADGADTKASPPDRAVEAGRGALFIGLAKVFFMVSGFLQQTLLARLIGVADFGIFGVVNQSVSTLNNAVVQGTVQAVSKFTAEDDARADAVKRAALRMQVVLGTAVGLAFFAGAPWIAAFYKHPELVPYFRTVALIPFFYSFYSVFVGSANGQRKFRVQAGFDMGFSTIKTVLMLGAAAVFGLAGAFAGFAAAAFAILCIAAVVMKLPTAGGASFPIGRLVAFMAGIVLYTLLINSALNYDILLLRRFAAVALPGDAAAANTLAGHYSGVRNLALLPYQALIVVTFVIFPLVSRTTFQNDPAATRAYVRQTLRYALILGVAMAVVLGSRPAGTMRLIYKPEYVAGAPALPILVTGIVFLSLLSVACAIINGSGRPAVAAALVAVTLVAGGGAAFAMVPRATPGPAMLTATATATALGMAAGFLVGLAYVWRRFSAGVPLASVGRVLVAGAAAWAAGHFFPGQGKVATLAALAVAGLAFFVAIVLLGEIGPEDRAKFRKILRLDRAPRA